MEARWEMQWESVWCELTLNCINRGRGGGGGGRRISFDFDCLGQRLVENGDGTRSVFPAVVLCRRFPPQGAAGLVTAEGAVSRLSTMLSQVLPAFVPHEVSSFVLEHMEPYVCHVAAAAMRRTGTRRRSQPVEVQVGVRVVVEDYGDDEVQLLMDQAEEEGEVGVHVVAEDYGDDEVQLLMDQAEEEGEGRMLLEVGIEEYSRRVAVASSVSSTEAPVSIEGDGGEDGRHAAATGDCAICLEEMAAGEVSWMPCCHRFHAKCIRPWLRRDNRCPICRQPV